MNNLILFLFFIVLLIGTAEILRRWMGGSQEFSRKFVHMATGILVALTPFFFISKWPMVILGLLFAIVDYVAIKMGWLKGMHHGRRRSYGTVFYPVSFVILVLLLWDQYRLILVCAMLIMALADAAAAIVGENIKHPTVFQVGSEQKSLQGSAAMFVVSLIIVAVALLVTSTVPSVLHIVWIAAAVAIFATVCEAVSYQGSDNLTVPLGCALIMHYLLTQPVAEGWVFTIGMGLAILVAFVSYRVKFLTPGGAVATMILGTVVFGIGRWAFSIPILTFFVLSSLLSRVGKKRKKKFAGLIEKSGARDLWQVAANGGLAGMMVLLWYFFGHSFWYLLFAGSLASVTADTWGTEIGMLSRSKPRFILNFKPVPAGTSGGISLLGTSGAAVGALILAAVSVISSPHHSSRVLGWKEFSIIFFAGLIASLFDSFLGATVQAKYRCTVCGKETEKKIHCRHPAAFVEGYRWINNDVVNVLAALFGIGLAYVLYTAL
ncbi:DUF92 domain-containing protein [candidate division KSB1 bacterium]|nr:DUF92 domain-containing protein [candidate division KSB1 bacterium]